MDMIKELKTLSQRIFNAEKKLSDFSDMLKKSAEIEISDLVLDNMEAQQTISDLELDVIELKGE